MAEPRPLAVYVHWPFCAAKCPYCDFNSHVAPPPDHAAWAAAFEAEVDRLAAEVAPATVTSVFFGGGTPSLMAPATVERTIARLQSRLRLANDAEITLEANPTSVEAGKFRDFRAAGVNRASLGVQALDDADLRRLGRLHTADQALDALRTARDTFDRVSFDLIYARQDQTEAAWRAELARALALGPDHLSLYQLTVEPETAFGARHAAGRLPGLPDEDRAVDLWHATQELTLAAGLPAYEVSNHARPGAESRHNLTYWRGGEWLGIGPGAHGRFRASAGWVRTEGHPMPADWLAAAGAGDGERLRAPVGDAERAELLILMGLRLSEGVDLARHDALAGPSPLRTRAESLARDGLVALRDDRLVATPRGRLLLNAVIEALLA